jgi:hypothetical protein
MRDVLSRVVAALCLAETGWVRGGQPLAINNPEAPMTDMPSQAAAPSLAATSHVRDGQPLTIKNRRLA